MKNPFWMVNITLLIFFLLVLLFMVVFRITIPEREDIAHIPTKASTKEQLGPINLSKIYNYDLFDTYRKEIPAPMPTERPSLPAPPAPEQLSIPELPKTEFLDPLDITLRGILVLNKEESKNRAILVNNKTQRESSYKVGDSIEDSQLIRILTNKIIFLRSNGQQEVLYLREQDVKLDPMYAQINGWTKVIQHAADGKYRVDPQAFVQHVTNLALFIDMLGLSTAYKQGHSIGCRTGILAEKSLGAALGFKSGDIITDIDGTPINTTPERLEAYKKIIQLPLGSTVTVHLLRKQQIKELQFVLEQFASIGKEKQAKDKETTEEEKAFILKQKNNLAPTIEEIRKKEKQTMLNKGKAPQRMAPA